MKDIISNLNKIESSKRRRDALDIFDIMVENIPDKPKQWERNVVGFGDYHYVNKTNEGDMPIIGLVPAKAHITLYFAVGGLDKYNEYLGRIGKYKRGKICLYISNLEKVDKVVLANLIKHYYQDVLDGKTVYRT